jgi:hypothetical protein
MSGVVASKVLANPNLLRSQQGIDYAPLQQLLQAEKGSLQMI